MNAYKPASEADEIDQDETIDPIHAELLRAKTRQRRRHLLFALVLVLAAVFTLGLIVFSNGTVIEVHPEQAKDTTVLSVVDTLGGAIGHTAYSLAGTPTIKVTATGFKPLQKTLLASETGGRVSIELSEIPQLLSVTTTPNSDKTRWFIDGNMVRIASQLRQKLFSGEHAIEIDSPYYRKKTFTVVMELAKGLDRSIDLQPVSGRMDITTVPAGASVKINGEQRGLSPLSINSSGGQYRLEVSLGDFQTISEDVEITNTDKVIERDYRLVPKDAYVHISLSPAGGMLLLNGKQVAASAGKLEVKARIANTLIYHKSGYFSQQKTITIAPGVEKKLSFRLKAEMGEVDIRSKPGASVFVDGKRRGKTPLVIQLSALPHRIELRRPGFRSYKKTLRPSSKSRQKIRAVLRTELQAKLSEAPSQFNNSLGMKLKLFKPLGSFVMGAPRYEKGQRANEFLRTVQLTRPFYVSKHEVTAAQYARFSKKGGGLLPASSVSWIEAAQFCNWLSLREKLSPFYIIRNAQLRGFNISADGYRLPSEAEWEWLARKAGKATQSKFTWGDATTIPEKSGNIADEAAKGQTTRYVPNYSDGFAGIAPVGSYPAEPSGLYDLTGNVSEWVHDVYSLVPPAGQKTEIDPLGENSGDTHTVKGSNWRSGSITELRASYRDGAKAGRDDIGFRVARYID